MYKEDSNDKDNIYNQVLQNIMAKAEWESIINLVDHGNDVNLKPYEGGHSSYVSALISQYKQTYIRDSIVNKLCNNDDIKNVVEEQFRSKHPFVDENQIRSHGEYELLCERQAYIELYGKYKANIEIKMDIDPEKIESHVSFLKQKDVIDYVLNRSQ